MKKKSILFILSVLLLFTACDKQDANEISTNPEGTVRVDLILPGTYGYPVSRAPGNLIPLPPKKKLPKGSTIWLITLKKDGEGNYTPYTVPKPYVVDVGSEDFQTLYPIKCIDNGDTWSVDPEMKSSDPLYLEEGTYKFRMLSPAKTLSKDEYKVSVNNGEYFYATDERYIETMANDIEVSLDPDNSVKRITLNPMINQTARIWVKLNKGDFVHSLDIYPNGIEVSGVQNNTEGTDFNWGSQSLTDTLTAQRGDKRGRVYMNDFTKHDDGGISSGIGILPTNAESSSVVLLINIKVNGVPTLLQAMLNKMVFCHARSYNFVFDVDIENGITIATPIYNSWTITEYI